MKRSFRKALFFLLAFALMMGVMSATALAEPPIVGEPGLIYPSYATIGGWGSEPTAKTGLVANGSVQQLINAGLKPLGTGYYYMTQEDITGEQANNLFFPSGGSKPGSFSTDIPTGIAAGMYYVWYAVDGGGSYDDSMPYEEINGAYVSHKLTVTIITAHKHTDTAGNEISFQAWTETDSLPTSGSWYLTDNVTLGNTWTVNNTVDLCLDGYTVTTNGFDAVRVSDTGILNLYDEDGENGGITVEDPYRSNAMSLSGGFNLYGGALRGPIELKQADAVFNMFDGSVIDGSVWVQAGSFNLSGGTVEFNGQSAVIVEDRFNMTGGTAHNSTTGVEIRNTNGASISGGSITGNSIGVLVYNSELAISGSLDISGNNNQNVFLLNGMLNVTDRLDDTVRLSVFMMEPGVFTSGLPGHGSLENFLNGKGEGYRVGLTAENEAQIEEHHEHSFTYSGGGKGVYDVIIATCTAENCPLTNSRVSIDLDPPAEPVYDGNPKAPVVNGLEAFKEATGLPDSAFSYTYQSIPAGKDDPELDGLPTDAGRYEVWLAVNYGGSSPIRASVSFTIVPPHIHEGITFDPWTSTDSLPTSAGSYYLAGNVTLDVPWYAPTGTTNLCLNGKTISGGSGNNITINDASQTLNIYSEEDAVGEITAGVDIASGAVNLYGGTLKGGVSNVGIFHMYGGTINSMGGISNGTDWFDGQFIMEGGLITGSQLYGVSNGNLGTFTMSGGSITGNRVGVYADGVVNISGSAKIQGNTEKNVELNLGSYIAVSDSLSADARIGVSLMTFVGLNEEQTTGVFTSGLSGRGTADNFFSDNDSYVVRMNASGEAQLMDPSVHIHDGVTFEAWTSTNSLPTSGSYYLTENVTVSNQTYISSTLNLCLNGKSITMSNGWGSVYCISGNERTLNLYDCDSTVHYYTPSTTGPATLSASATDYSFTGGYITGVNNAPAITVTEDGSLNIYGGTIFGNRNNGNGGGLFLGTYDWDPASAHMYGGNIIGNYADCGAGIYKFHSAKFTMSGGTVMHNSGGGGGGILAHWSSDSEDCIFNMTGGVIAENYGGWASGICGTAKVTGGSIINNTSNGDDPGIEGGNLRISGNPTIYGNKTSNGAEKNIGLNDGQTIKVIGDLTNTTPIGVTMANPGVFTSGLSGHGDETNFTSDNDSYAVSLNSDGEAQLMDPSVHYHNGIIFVPWESTDSLPTDTGNYYLTADVTTTVITNIGNGVNVNLCLNGHNLQTTFVGSLVHVQRGGTLSIYDDASVEGTIGHINEKKGGCIAISGTFNLYGGTVTGNNMDFAGAGIYITDNGTFNMRGGSISGNYSNGSGSYGGAGVYVNNGTFNLYDGSIDNNHATNSSGGGIKVYVGTLNIFGGSITDNTAVNGGGGVYVDTSGAMTLSGDPVISGNTDGNVYLTTDKVITVNDNLTYATPIDVTMQTPGVFTSGLSGRGDLDNFTSGNPDYVVTLSDDGEARLTIMRYNFSYDENGAEGGALPMADTYTYDHGTTVTVQGNNGDLTRSGYAFTGWNTAADGSGTAYNSGDSFQITDNTTLYAQWTRTYNVTLHLNGGTLNGDDLTYYVEGVGATLPTDLTREGYNFDGWYDNEAMLGSPVTKIGATATGAREFWVKWFFKAYHVYVVTPDGAKTMYTGMEPSERVSVLKNMIAAQTGVPAARISLAYGGRVLSDNVTLANYNIQKGYTVRATFAPDVVPDFELFYTLNSDVDEDADRYRDYRVGEDVVATIYLRPLSDTVLQAFDIFMTHADGLVRTDVRSQYGELVTEGDRPTNTTHIRIQAIGKEQGNKIEVPIAGGEVYELARVTFRFADFVNYDIGQRITLLENSNIAIANTPESFTPGIGGDTDGAELRGTYLITFDDNVPDREIQVPVPMLARQMLNETLPDDIPVRPGYIFRGWDTDPEAETPAYQPGGSYRGSEDTTLYAIWDTEMYTVTFYDEDGLTIIQNERYPFGTRTATITPVDPVKQGDAQYSYVFKGWEPKLSELVVADAAYTAVYERIENTYTIIFQNWDGAILQTDTLKYGETPVYNGETPTHPDEPGNTYNFQYWSPDIVPVTEDATYIAVFDPEVIYYSVTFDAHSHGRTPAQQSIGYGGLARNPGELYDTGWIFEGWYKAADGGDPWNFDIDTITGDTTIHAHWRERQYRVMYNANGGSGEIPEQWVSYTGNVTLSDGAALNRNGYHFAGWNTQPNGGGQSFTGTVAMTALLPYVNNETVTLYAVWTADDYVITYELDGGALSGGQQNPTSYNAENLPLDIPFDPAKTGYSFAGWRAAYTASGATVMLDGGRIIPAGTLGNLTVTALWTPAEVSYSVKHYQQYVDGDGYALYKTEYKTGLTGDQTAAEPLNLTGFTAKSFAQKIIQADGSTEVEIYYDRNYHSVTYSYTNAKPDGAPAAPATVQYKYGKSVTVDNVPNVTGYEFQGWTTSDVQPENGRFTMPDTDVSFTGTWVALAVPYTVEHWQQNVNDDDYTLAETDSSLTGKAGDMTQAAPNVYTGFTVVPYEQQTILSDGSTVVRIYYDRVTHMVSYIIDGAPQSLAIPQTVSVRVGALVPVEEIPAPDGYTISALKPTKPDGTELQLDNENRFEMPDTDVQVIGTCTPISYTITFDVSFGENPVAPMTYTIQSTDELPGAVSQQYRFDGWKVTAEDGNWALNALYNAGTAVTGKYGNITLTAQWTEKVTYIVEEYKYAPSGWYMLRIMDDLSENQSYAFGGEPMFVISDENYRVENETNTFYTLISGDFVEGSKLTLTGFSMITTTEGDRFTVDYNGDVNNDEVVNIADANAVFQMLAQSSYGGYYGIEQLTVRDRLAADMVKSIHNADHRGSIEDVNAIVNLVIGRN